MDGYDGDKDKEDSDSIEIINNKVVRLKTMYGINSSSIQYHNNNKNNNGNTPKTGGRSQLLLLKLLINQNNPISLLHDDIYIYIYTNI